jgi:hypothetical protein
MASTWGNDLKKSSESSQFLFENYELATVNGEKAHKFIPTIILRKK